MGGSEAETASLFRFFASTRLSARSSARLFISGKGSLFAI